MWIIADFVIQLAFKAFHFFWLAYQPYHCPCNSCTSSILRTHGLIFERLHNRRMKTKAWYVRQPSCVHKHIKHIFPLVNRLVHREQLGIGQRSTEMNTECQKNTLQSYLEEHFLKCFLWTWTTWHTGLLLVSHFKSQPHKAVNARPTLQGQLTTSYPPPAFRLQSSWTHLPWIKVHSPAF